ncbi:MAG TPA: SCP2 sterol-binding domain-containing protein [Kofleriaceae bacterium]|nr:SCP2 sterol-binding domain-containing protein [Kofleriaceae bacterium]
MVPADLTPAQFFETYLPAEWARARAGQPAAADATFEVVLDGDGGGTWTIAVRGGALSATAAAATTTPDLRVHMTTQDFRAAMQGEAGAPDLFPHELDLATALARIPAGAAPTAPKGSVEIHISGFNGRTWSIGLATGGATAPGATVTVDADTILAIKNGSMDPASAFFSGKIQLGGDVAWIMQAGMGFMQGRRGPLN